MGRGSTRSPHLDGVTRNRVLEPRDSDKPPGIGDSREPKLLDRVRGAMRVRHMKWSTEKSYLSWIRRYIIFHGKRHPAEMGAAEISAFLTDLATKKRVSASTQNQALCALRGSTPPPTKNGAGSTSSHLASVRRTAGREPYGGSTCRPEHRSGRSGMPFAALVFTSTPRATRCDTPSLPNCFGAATTFARCRSSWAMPTSTRR
jgi:Phage integrase, N-terminal SAM-like domain